jgi:hypothetical protein
MSSMNSRSVSIAADHNRPTLSKGQKAFNTLIRQIEKRRARLGAWETVAPAFQHKYVNELLPLQQTSTDLQIRLVRRLDELHGQKGLTQTERRTVASLIAGLAGDLIEETDDAGLKAIYNRHSGSDYDSEAAADAEDMKSVIEAMFDIELGDDIDMSSPEEVLQRAHAQMQQKEVDEASSNVARRNDRKKSPRQRAAEAEVWPVKAKNPPHLELSC